MWIESGIAQHSAARMQEEEREELNRDKDEKEGEKETGNNNQIPQRMKKRGWSRFEWGIYRGDIPHPSYIASILLHSFVQYT